MRSGTPKSGANGNSNRFPREQIGQRRDDPNGGAALRLSPPVAGRLVVREEEGWLAGFADDAL